MKLEEIVKELENLSDDTLDYIATRIEIIKSRKEDECFNIVDKLNELLKPLKEYAYELEGGERLSFKSEQIIDSLVHGEFVVNRNFEGRTYINWEE